MVAIASISLLVGGIGIMNIMLASVMERTREIGVRRAVGATRRDIIRQFLIETTLITVTGGFAGTVVGVVLSQLVAYFAGWSTIIRSTSVVRRLRRVGDGRHRVRPVSGGAGRRARSRLRAALRIGRRGRRTSFDAFALPDVGSGPPHEVARGCSSTASAWTSAARCVSGGSPLGSRVSPCWS